ncbi:MAG: PilZ domain protein [Candidatus Omnitrophica bacterium ADurb.Bin292]|jgi:hypothetical protein|nr:MAG: PilZ domain protein [Candidatus Omnitrophica bacterium ADurb.Bin292]HPW77267.1 PilZ domain-containing protein [Candidatus Omnitrophota bacterium]HQB12800.1 PilZ domain-containing protein [Candidatus Omnitrophota bacterium]
MTTDQRKFYRHPIKAPIRLREVTGTDARDSKSEDISSGGLSFFWPSFLAKGTRLELSIPIEQQLFKMKARVAYCRKDGGMDLFRTGVCFEDSTSAFRAKLAEEIIQIRNYREQMRSLRGKEISEEEAADQWIRRNAENFAKLLG